MTGSGDLYRLNIEYKERKIKAVALILSAQLLAMIMTVLVVALVNEEISGLKVFITIEIIAASIGWFVGVKFFERGYMHAVVIDAKGESINAYSMNGRLIGSYRHAEFVHINKLRIKDEKGCIHDLTIMESLDDIEKVMNECSWITRSDE